MPDLAFDLGFVDGIEPFNLAELRYDASPPLVN
jgi:hypothetical protein